VQRRVRVTVLGNFVDQIMDRLYNRVQRVFIARQQHPRRQSAGALAVAAQRFSLPSRLDQLLDLVAFLKDRKAQESIRELK